MKFGLGGNTPMMQRKIGEELGKSHQRISQIEIRAFRKLTHLLEARSLTDYLKDC